MESMFIVTMEAPGRARCADANQRTQRDGCFAAERVRAPDIKIPNISFVWFKSAEFTWMKSLYFAQRKSNIIPGMKRPGGVSITVGGMLHRVGGVLAADVAQSQGGCL